MGRSARVLGEKYGLNAQEMNELLRNQGFLEGTPGNYIPTEKGMPYVTEKYHRRGTGGYSCYNPHWETRTWDDSIEEVLRCNPKETQRAIDAVAERNRKRREKPKVTAEKMEESNIPTNSVHIMSNDTNNSLLNSILETLIENAGTIVVEGAMQAIEKIIFRITSRFSKN